MVFLRTVRRKRAFCVLIIVSVSLISYTLWTVLSKITAFVGLHAGSIHQDSDGLFQHCTQSAAQKEDQEVYNIIENLDQIMPSVTFTDIKSTTSAAKSRVTLLNPKNSYCVGDHLMVRLDLYNHLGQRKEYGGDFLRVRIHSPQLRAGASGHIEDYGNGTYLVDFTLFWKGTVSVSLLLIHPSEGTSALWAARKKGYDKIAFTGQFLNGTTTVSTLCGFLISSRAELCEYRDERDREVFYCVKPEKVPCDAFVLLLSNNHPTSYLTDLERTLLDGKNIGVEIPEHFGEIHVANCNRSQRVPRKSCSIGMRSPPPPSGFMWHNQWHPVFCRLSNVGMSDHVNSCLQRKLVHLRGDSTLRQWMGYLMNKVDSLKKTNIYGYGKVQSLLAVDMTRNIHLQWKKHGHPFVTVFPYTVIDHTYVAREIDSLVGNGRTAVVVSLGQHFRPFPIQLFIRRILNIRAAIQRLLLRSPETKVILKTENIRELHAEPERFSDFHGYAQYLVTREVFRGLHVGIIDAWDMSVAYATNEVHVPNTVVGSQVKMFLTYIC